MGDAVVSETEKRMLDHKQIGRKSSLEEKANEILKQLNDGKETRMTEAEFNSLTLNTDVEDHKRLQGGEEAMVSMRDYKTDQYNVKISIIHIQTRASMT
jgi:hypothetical protein